MKPDHNQSAKALRRNILGSSSNRVGQSGRVLTSRKATEAATAGMGNKGSLDNLKLNAQAGRATQFNQTLNGATGSGRTGSMAVERMPEANLAARGFKLIGSPSLMNAQISLKDLPHGKSQIYIQGEGEHASGRLSQTSKTPLFHHHIPSATGPHLQSNLNRRLLSAKAQPRPTTASRPNPSTLKPDTTK